MSLVLASGSPRRRELLRLVEEDFIVHPVDAEETLPAGMPLEMAAIFLADKKAALAAKLFPEDIVIGCDTVVMMEDELLGKPKDREDARRMLRLLSGRTHTVMTGVALYLGAQTTAFTSETKVTFYPFGEEETEAYLDTGEPFDKAGAYGIQGKGALLVQGIEGDFFNVVGLPVAKLARQLREFRRVVRHPRLRLKTPREIEDAKKDPPV